MLPFLLTLPIQPLCSSARSCPTVLTHSMARPGPGSQGTFQRGPPVPSQEWVCQPESLLRQTAGSPPPCKHSQCRLVTAGPSHTDSPASSSKRHGNHQIKETTEPVSAALRPRHLWMGSIGSQTSCTHTAYRVAGTGAYRPLPPPACLYLPGLSPAPSST